MASLEDYQIAYELAKDVLATTLHELSREAQDLYQVILECAKDNAPERPREVIFRRRDLRSVTDLEDHRLRQSLNELVDMEYLEALQGGQGRVYQYRLTVGEATVSPFLRELTTPEELQRRWKPGKD